MQERIASGENITSWVLLREAYRGIPANSYNYAVSITFDGTPVKSNVQFVPALAQITCANDFTAAMKRFGVWSAKWC